MEIFYFIFKKRLSDAVDIIFYLLSGTQQSIKTLNLAKTNIPGSSIYNLCRMFQYNTTLFSLNLSDNKFKEDSYKIISLAISSNSTICHLNIANCLSKSTSQSSDSSDVISQINSKISSNVISSFLYFFPLFPLSSPLPSFPLLSSSSSSLFPFILLLPFPFPFPSHSASFYYFYKWYFYLSSFFFFSFFPPLLLPFPSLSLSLPLKEIFKANCQTSAFLNINTPFMPFLSSFLIFLLLSQRAFVIWEDLGNITHLPVYFVQLIIIINSNLFLLVITNKRDQNQGTKCQ